MNMYVQLFSGLRCEKEWGSKVTALVYFAAGVGGCLASAAGSPASVGVGASGAIVGLVACRAGRLGCEWGARDPAARSRESWQAITFLLLLGAVGAPTAAGATANGGALDGVMPAVDNYAHGGGLLVGVLLGVLLWGSDPGTCGCPVPSACLDDGGPATTASSAWEGGGGGGSSSSGGDGGRLGWRWDAMRAWAKGLNRLQRSTLCALALYFGVLAAVLATTTAPDRTIRC
jgi:hypothetical protein